MNTTQDYLHDLFRHMPDKITFINGVILKYGDKITLEYKSDIEFDKYILAIYGKKTSLHRFSYTLEN